ncbi:putative C16orf48-like protein [Naja naja]|nr:putative C16orf48-like protein [Naja naja]
MKSLSNRKKNYNSQQPPGSTVAKRPEAGSPTVRGRIFLGFAAEEDVRGAAADYRLQIIYEVSLRCRKVPPGSQVPFLQILPYVRITTDARYQFSLYPGCYSARCPQPPPRIKPNARDILEKGQNGTVGVLLKLDEISFFEELRPKQIQRKCREKEQARQLSQPKPVKALWKSQKYENVESKVKAKLQSINKVLEQKQKDLEEYNTKQKGHVPHYLIERKDHWRKEAEERLRNTPDPDTPPGHAMMPENQRLETLKNLKESQEKLLKELLLLPVRIDSLSVQTRRVSLEKKLSHIEEALKIFSRPKVFIKLDS